VSARNRARNRLAANKREADLATACAPERIDLRTFNSWGGSEVPKRNPHAARPTAVIRQPSASHQFLGDTTAVVGDPL
jgi:hypothetical protein